MATIKLKLDMSYKPKGKIKSEITYPLVIKVSHRGVWKNVQMGYNLKEREWDENKERVTRSYTNSGRANAKISRKWAIAEETLTELTKPVLKNMDVYQVAQLIEFKIKEELETKNSITAAAFQSQQTKLKEYCEKVVARLKKAKRNKYAIAFEDAVTAVINYHGRDDLLMSDIDKTFLEDLEADWLSRDNGIGGLAVHLRQIRRLFNLAIDDNDSELILDQYPFGRRGYTVKKGKGNKRAMDLDDMQKIVQYKYKEGSASWHHRNYFLFMFYLRGMNFMDLAHLRMENLNKDRIIYERRKTRRGENVKAFNIKLIDEAKCILNYYSAGKKKKNDLIFPILEDVIHCGDSEVIQKTYKQRADNHNKRLKKIAKDVDINVNLTTYVARHTFATTALFKGLSKTKIGEMMGHTSAVTTEAYLDQFDKKVLDEAADVVFSKSKPAVKNGSANL